MPDNFPSKIFDLIYRRAPTEGDRTRLLGVRTALGVGDNDEVWPILILFDQYATTFAAGRRDLVKVFDGMHDRIGGIVDAVEGAVEEKADRAMARVVESGSQKLLGIVQQAQDAANRINRTQFLTAAIIGGVCTVLCLLAGGAAGYHARASVGDICTSPGFTTTDGRMGCYID